MDLNQEGDGLGSVCRYCGKNMKDPETTTCTWNTEVFFPATGESLPSSSDHFDEPSGRCHDCNIVLGQKHHPGCDAERCPKCGGQLISCGCLDMTDEYQNAIPRKGEEKEQKDPVKWEAYALDACQCIMDASMFWNGWDEEKFPILKRARTMAGKALEKWKEEGCP